MSVTVKILAGGVIPDLDGGTLDLTTPGSVALLLETQPLAKIAVDDTAPLWLALRDQAVAMATERLIELDGTATIAIAHVTAGGSPDGDAGATHAKLRMLVPGTRTGRQPPRSELASDA